MSPARMPFEAVFEDESGGNIKTPQSDIALIRRRLKDAETDNAERQKEKKP